MTISQLVPFLSFLNDIFVTSSSSHQDSDLTNIVFELAVCDDMDEYDNASKAVVVVVVVVIVMMLRVKSFLNIIICVSKLKRLSLMLLRVIGSASSIHHHHNTTK